MVLPVGGDRAWAWRNVGLGTIDSFPPKTRGGWGWGQIKVIGIKLTSRIPTAECAANLIVS